MKKEDLQDWLDQDITKEFVSHIREVAKSYGARRFKPGMDVKRFQAEIMYAHGYSDGIEEIDKFFAVNSAKFANEKTRKDKQSKASTEEKKLDRIGEW